MRALLKLRSLPSAIAGNACEPLDASSATLLDTIGHGFFLVDEQPEREIVLGTIGGFWKLRGGKQSGSPDDLANGPPPGTAAAVWNFRVTRYGKGSTVHTETRVLCADKAALRKFRRYWTVVGPFSALIRRKMLAAIKLEAESAEPVFL